MKLNSLCLLLFSGTAVLGAISRDGSCGGSRGATCLNSAFGNCCSQYGYCGRTSAYCGTGCQKRFGTCGHTPQQPPAHSPTRTRTQPPVQPTQAPTTKISTNGKCGPGVTCLGSKFGYCCSEYGYCGRTKEYCNSGCQKAFGSCTQLSAGDISTNARCGGTDGYTCLGSVFGDCCSQYGYCGSSTPYCGTGCQPGFGECNGQASSSTFSILTSSTSSSASSTSSSTASTSSTSSLSSSAESTIDSSTSSAFASSSITSSTEVISSATSSTEEASITSSIEETSSTTLSTEETTTASTEETSTTSLTEATSTSTEGPTPSPPPACLELPFECEHFEGPLTGSCGNSQGKCKDGWIVRCFQIPSGTYLIQDLTNSVTNGDECAAACDAQQGCAAFVFGIETRQNPAKIHCQLYSNGRTVAPSGFLSTYVRICPKEPALPPGTQTSITNSTTETSTLTPETSTSTSTMDTSSPTSGTSTAETNTAELPSSTLTLDTGSSTSSTSSEAPSPTCNYVTNGDWAVNSFKDWVFPYEEFIPRAAGKIAISGASGPLADSGPDTSIAIRGLKRDGPLYARIYQANLVGLKSGDIVTCSARYFIEGAGVHSIELSVGGRRCAYLSTTSRSTVWQGFGLVEPTQIVLDADSPEFSVHLHMNGTDSSGSVLGVRLDNFVVDDGRCGTSPTLPSDAQTSTSAFSTESSASVTETTTLETTSTATTEEIVSTSSPTPIETCSSENLLSNGGFETDFFASWSLARELLKGSPTVAFPRGSKADANGETGIWAEYFHTRNSAYEPSSFGIKQNVAGLKAGDAVVCSGRYFLESEADVTIEMSIGGLPCAVLSTTSTSTTWQDITGSPELVVVPGDNPEVLIKISSDGRAYAGPARVVVRLDNFAVRRCSVAPSSTSSSFTSDVSATTAMEASVTEVATSDVATSTVATLDATTSTVSEPNEPTPEPIYFDCRTNLVSNSGFNTPEELSPWTIEGGEGAHLEIVDGGHYEPWEGSHHFEVATTSSTSLKLHQTITRYPLAGRKLACTTMFRYYAPQIIEGAGVTVEMSINGQLCAYRSFGPEPDEYYWAQTQYNGDVLLETDTAVIEVSISLTTGDGAPDGEAIGVYLDDVQVFGVDCMK